MADPDGVGKPRYPDLALDKASRVLFAENLAKPEHTTGGAKPGGGAGSRGAVPDQEVTEELGVAERSGPTGRAAALSRTGFGSG